MLQDLVTLNFRKCMARIALFAQFDTIVIQYTQQLGWLEEKFPTEYEKARYEYASFNIE